MPFSCSICGEESTRICAGCTKDACSNHLCERCLRCSDCCECEVRLNEPITEPMYPIVRTVEAPPPDIIPDVIEDTGEQIAGPASTGSSSENGTSASHQSD